MLNIPLMSNNIEKSDVEALIDFLQTSERFTNGPKVKEFEQAWSEWLGGNEYSVFVNSGSSANYITMAAIRELYGEGEVILSPIGWTSDICSVFAAGLTPVFVDVNKENLALNVEQVIGKMNSNTRAVLLTHVLGHNGLTKRLIDECHRRKIILIEDVCESHGATFDGKRCGSLGDVSNFSFYYAHHMSTIEGGMVCTNNKDIYRMARMIRSHGMLREADDREYMDAMIKEYPQLHSEFIFPIAGYNMRSTELNAVIGLNQLKRLDENIKKRTDHYKLFLSHLDEQKYFTDFDAIGSSNYAFVIMLRKPDKKLFEKVIEMLTNEAVEFRRGTAGGGNFLRQPYVRRLLPEIQPDDFPNAEFIHEFGIYVGNYPSLSEEKIIELCEKLNNL